MTVANSELLEFEAIVKYLRTEGFAAFGQDGDYEGRSTSETVIGALRAYAQEKAAAASDHRWRHVERGTSYIELGRAIWVSDASTSDMQEIALSQKSPGAWIAGHRISGLGWKTAKVQCARPARFGDALVVYQAEEDGSLWARPYAEFMDGRFERIVADRTERERAPVGGFVVANGTGTRWRRWVPYEGCVWTENRALATRFARREDAEAVHFDDDDAWLIQPYVTPFGSGTLPASALAEALAVALKDLKAARPGAFWILGEGRLSEKEPLYGFQVLFGEQVLAAGEGDTPEAAIDAACRELAAATNPPPEGAPS